MTILSLKSDTNPIWAKDVTVDTVDVLAVQNLGFVAMSDGTFAHRRKIYTADSLTTLWERSKVKEVPSSIATLDNLGDKKFVRVARSGSYGSTNASELNGATSVNISVEPEDLEIIKVKSTHGTLLATGTTVNGSFTESAKGKTLGTNERMLYALLQVGNNVLPIAKLEEKDAYGKIQVNKALAALTYIPA